MHLLRPTSSRTLAPKATRGALSTDRIAGYAKALRPRALRDNCHGRAPVGERPAGRRPGSIRYFQVDTSVRSVRASGFSFLIVGDSTMTLGRALTVLALTAGAVPAALAADANAGKTFFRAQCALCHS